jgi:uncharacterized protein
LAHQADGAGPDRDSGSSTPGEVFAALVRGVCDRRTDLAELYAEPTRVTHPLQGDDALTTRATLSEHFASTRAVLGDVELAVTGAVVHETADPELIVAEFRYAVGPARTEVPCVFVMRVRGGLIVESRDYMDLQAFGRALAWNRTEEQQGR